MFRIVTIALVLAGCVRQAPAPVAPKPVAVVAPKPAPINLVCTKFAKVNPSATCEPELTDDGPTHIHTATITLQGQQLACRQDTTLLGILCSDPIVIKLQPPPPTQDAPKPEPAPKAAPKKAAPKK